jgi:hypothetical protein
LLGAEIGPPVARTTPGEITVAETMRNEAGIDTLKSFMQDFAKRRADIKS